MKDDGLDEMLLAKEPEVKETIQNGFNPKFNVREEFPIWVKEQFRELRTYVKKREVYPDLEIRKDEVYQAALGVVTHGVLSTDACATARLKRGWEEFERGFGKEGKPQRRARSLERFVEAIEDLSLSLGGNSHYTEAGTFISGLGYRRGNLNAFVYRIGDKNSKDSKYLVFEEPQKFESENQPILIGELTRLMKIDIIDLKKLAKRFRGPEAAFIEHVDRIAPDEGIDSNSGYGSGTMNTIKSLGNYMGSFYGKGEEDGI